MKIGNLLRGVRAPWLVTYLCLPLGFILLEYATRFAVGVSRGFFFDLFPYASASVAFAILALFVKDELSEISFLNGEDKDLQDQASHKALMDLYAVLFVASMFGNTLLESQIAYRNDYGMSDVLGYIRAGTIVLSLAFLGQIVSSQQRFSLRAG